MNIFDIPIYYIAFNTNKKLEEQCKKLGFNNINHFPAIDGRKFTPKELFINNMITIRAYKDLIYNRNEHAAMPSLGGIGCFMSHRTLWEKCINDNLPHIIILEDDVKLPGTLSNKVIEKIQNTLADPIGMFVSANINKNNHIFQGSHFCALNKATCEKLVEYAYPIDIQVDYYIAFIGNNMLNNINIEGYKFAGQNHHRSFIQDVCIKCNLPTSLLFYIIIIAAIILIIILSIFFFKAFKKYKSKFTTCSNSLKSCKGE
jgi:GR25 family glycosyltransferase involved in LPS biosynthesis